MHTAEALNILGLQGSPSESEIKKAYRTLALQYHPDKNQGSKESEEKFKQVAEAYQCLTDPNYGQGSGAGMGGFTFGHFHEMDDLIRKFMFGGDGGRVNRKQAMKKPCPTEIPIRLPDLNLGAITVPLYRALLGDEIIFKAEVQACCSDCLSDDSRWAPCNTCKQVGTLFRNHKGPFGQISQSTYCPDCGGVGWKSAKHCRVCKDHLVFKKTKEVKFKIPKNYITGNKIRLQKSGNENWKAPNSDIYLLPVVSIPSVDLLSLDEREQLRRLLEGL